MTLLVGSAVKTTEANGPCCDLNMALSGSVKVLCTPSCLCSWSYLAAFRCQPYLGWFGSGSNSARGGVSTNSGHGGTTKPASTNNCWQVLTEWKHGPSSRSIPTINSLAIVGWRSLTIFMESAHDAQNAAVLTSRALVRPRPPWTVASWQWPLQTEAQTGFPEHLSNIPKPTRHDVQNLWGFKNISMVKWCQGVSRGFKRFQGVSNGFQRV